MYLIWYNANDWSWAVSIGCRDNGDMTVLGSDLPTILLVIFLNNKSELTFSDNLVIVLMPSADSRILGTWEPCKRMEIESIDDENKEIR